MKVRVYYGEAEDYNYIMFIRGNEFIVFYDTYNFIEISHENINKIVNNIAFNDLREDDFIDFYNVISLNFRGERGCGKLKYAELSGMLQHMARITEIVK